MTTSETPGVRADADLLAWLLDSDPSLRWQVQRDLAGASDDEWQATRARVPLEGHGKELLSHQDADGQWAGGAYFPADASRDEPGQPWTATTWSLNQLREWGVPASALLPDTAGLLDRNSRWEYEGLPYWGGEVDVCINAYTLANGAWLGADVRDLAAWFPAHQLADGGWNCEWVDGSVRSSFPSTLNAIIGILDYEQRTGGDAELRAARHRGQEYLLQRGLMRRLSTGEVHPWALQFGYPYRWAYSVLRASDHLRAASLYDGVEPDPRMADGIAVIEQARDADGTWHQRDHLEGRRWFEVDAPVGEPSKWLTFHALRVLQWWHAGQDVQPSSGQPDAD